MLIVGIHRCSSLLAPTVVDAGPHHLLETVVAQTPAQVEQGRDARVSGDPGQQRKHGDGRKAVHAHTYHGGDASKCGSATRACL